MHISVVPENQYLLSTNTPASGANAAPIAPRAQAMAVSSIIAPAHYVAPVLIRHELGTGLTNPRGRLSGIDLDNGYNRLTLQRQEEGRRAYDTNFRTHDAFSDLRCSTNNFATIAAATAAAAVMPNFHLDSSVVGENADYDSDDGNSPDRSPPRTNRTRQRLQTDSPRWDRGRQPSQPVDSPSRRRSERWVDDYIPLNDASSSRSRSRHARSSVSRRRSGGRDHSMHREASRRRSTSICRRSPSVRRRSPSAPSQRRSVSRRRSPSIRRRSPSERRSPARRSPSPEDRRFHSPDSDDRLAFEALHNDNDEADRDTSNDSIPPLVDEFDRVDGDADGLPVVPDRAVSEAIAGPALVVEDNDLVRPRSAANVSIAVISCDMGVAAISSVPDIEAAPFFVPHLFWDCDVQDENPDLFLPRRRVRVLIDNGSPFVLVTVALVDSLQLRRRLLPSPIHIDTATPSSNSASTLTEYVYISFHDSLNRWSSRVVRAIVAPSLCCDIIGGNPLLKHNSLIIDPSAHSLVHSPSGLNLLDMTVPIPVAVASPRVPLKVQISRTRNSINALRTELSAHCAAIRPGVDSRCEKVKLPDIVAAVRERIELLAAEEKLLALGNDLKAEFADVFSPLPHVDVMPVTETCRLELIDAHKTIATRSYACPRKFRAAWKTLIEQHLDAGRIRESSSSFASPAFLVLKADPTALPRWVNDYRQLNANLVMDRYPLPRIDDILADAATGKIWGKLDMTDSFFHTRLDDASIPLSAVSTPFGLYEWVVMPQGMKNSPSVHQRRVNRALRAYIGKFCHIYLDDIIIWSNSVEEHGEHVRLILEALRKEKLFCNAKKCEFFKYSLIFLGHRISVNGIEADNSKVERIKDWPTPQTPSDVRAFLGLVRYLAVFLPKLADHTRILDPLTGVKPNDWPGWSDDHEIAFQSIKSLVLSAECLTVIDHMNPGDNKIFVTTDASDWRTGAILSWGPSWETARPVAYDSMQFKGAQLRYPVHEKELLAIIRALKKFRADLLGERFYVYTDHRTLENFDGQRTLSRRQARWMEDMAQFDMQICYVKGEDNSVADALSRLPPDESAVDDEDPLEVPSWQAWLETRPVAAVQTRLQITADSRLLDQIRAGYAEDAFCGKFISGQRVISEVRELNGLWYIDDHLLIPRSGTIREDLFRLAHDVLGHFGADKSYAVLRDAYYWPNMRRDLEEAYIPACEPCMRNKSSTKRVAGPLHPLAVPDGRGDSVAIDFIGPLPMDEGFDYIATFTDRLGSDIRIVPTRTNLTAERMASLFFDHWYCENGLPSEIVCDRDKLFVSKFWTAFSKLTGVRMAMSSSFHPQTDGSSERTNKTVNQAIRYHVDRQQKGWVKALPRVRFGIMNTVNRSTGFSGFQL